MKKKSYEMVAVPGWVLWTAHSAGIQIKPKIATGAVNCKKAAKC